MYFIILLTQIWFYKIVHRILPLEYYCQWNTCTSVSPIDVSTEEDWVGATRIAL